MPLTARLVAVGSTNPAKIEAVRAAMRRLAPGAAVVAFDVPSGVSVQPWGDDETRLGAVGRARAALAAGNADYGIGLEGGVIDEGAHRAQAALPLEVELVSWVAVVDREGRIGTASGLRLMLPSRAAARLRAGAELGDVIDELFSTRESKKAAGAVGLLTEGFVSRSEAFADLVAMACAPFLFPKLYG